MQFEWRGDVLIVHLAGELDIYTVPALRRQLARHDRLETSLVVDLSGVEFIDSCGLRLRPQAVLEFRRRISSVAGTFALTR